MNEIIKAMKERRSIRKFKAELPSKANLEQIVEAGLYAASGMGKQATKVIVVTDKKLRDKIMEMNRKDGGWDEGFDPCYGAPVVLIVGCRNEEAWIRETDGVNAAKTDAAIVLTHLMLTATDMGLANMWIWDFDPRKVREVLPETREHGVYALLAIGYPKGTEGKPTEYHSVRKSLDEIVRYL